VKQTLPLLLPPAARLAIQLRARAVLELRKRSLRPAPPWGRAEASRGAAARRIEASLRGFWAFDALYFPPEVYGQGYSEPSGYHRHLAQRAQEPGVYVHLGARKHGKTVTAKKLAVWLLLTGRVTILGTLSQALPTSRRILADVRDFLRENPRITHDWRPAFSQDNGEQFAFTLRGPGAPTGRRIASAFSEGRSVRGYSKGFGRPEWLLCDDIETRKSPLGDDLVQKRGRVLGEAFASCADEGSLLVLGNNFDERSLMNRLWSHQQQGLLEEGWRAERFPAWMDERAAAAFPWAAPGPLWPGRYDAESESALRPLLKPLDEAEWQGDYLQQPRSPDGPVFLREHYREWGGANAPWPADARGVFYVDPNLALKAKGDTTAGTALYYSPKRDAFFVRSAFCRSFGDASELLDVALAVYRHLGRCHALGMDGHVSQESSWTSHIRAWSRLHEAPFPRVTFCRYRVDDLASAVSKAWSEGRILFPPGFAQDEEGARYLAQVFRFESKRLGKADDAPDSLICAYELLHERKIIRQPGAAVAAPVTIRPDIRF
jgi:hypothetical protein